MFIWTSETQIMANRRAMSQTANLTPNHKKSRIDLIYLATTLLQTTSRSEVCSQSYGAPKSQESHLARFRKSRSGVPGKKSHLNVSSVASHKIYYKGEGGGFPQVRVVVSLVCSCCPCCPWLVLAPKVFQLCTNHFVWVVCRPV